MAVEWTPIEYAKLDGGLNTQASLPALGDGEFVSMLNVQTNQDGSLSARPGYASIDADDATHPIGTGAFQFCSLAGAYTTLKTCKNSGAWSDSALKWLNVLTWTDVSQGLPRFFKNHDFCTFVQAGNFAYIFAFGGTNRMMKFNPIGPAMTEIAGAPLCQGGIFYYDRMWVWGDSSAPSTLYASATGSYENFTTGNSFSINVSPGDGDKITGLASIFNRLIVFKRRRIFTVDGTDFNTFSLLPVLADGGAVSARSILSIENRVLFLSDKGIYETDGSTAKLLSELIRPTRQALNLSRDQFTFAVHNRARSHYILTATSGEASAHDCALVYKYASTITDNPNLARAGWYYYNTWPFNAGGVFVNANNQERLFFLDTTGKTYAFEYDLAGVALPLEVGTGWNAQTRWMDHGAPHRSKKSRRLTIYVSTNAVVPTLCRTARIGVPANTYMSLTFTALADGSISVLVNTDFDTDTPKQTITIPSPAPEVTLITGILKYIIEAQVLGPRMIQV